jgi:hypothetical protein
VRDPSICHEESPGINRQAEPGGISRQKGEAMNTIADRNQRARAYLSIKAIQKAAKRNRINFILTAAALGLILVAIVFQTIFILTY